METSSAKPEKTLDLFLFQTLLPSQNDFDNRVHSYRLVSACCAWYVEIRL